MVCDLVAAFQLLPEQDFQERNPVFVTGSLLEITDGVVIRVAPIGAESAVLQHAAHVLLRLLIEIQVSGEGCPGIPLRPSESIGEGFLIRLFGESCARAFPAE